MDKEPKEKTEEDVKKYREIKIVPGCVGWKVIVGCSEFYASTWNEVITALKDYFEEPGMIEAYYMLHDQRFSIDRWIQT